MGLFDLPAPLYNAIQQLLDGLPPLLQLSLWAVLTGIVSMACYWFFSNQGKVTGAKEAALAARKALNAYEGHEFSEMWALVGATLRTSGKHFWIVLGPALLGSLPALTLIVWVSNQFGYQMPQAGDTLSITIETEAGDTASLALVYPAADATLPVTAADGEELTTLPLQAAIPVIHKKLWWNTLIANQAGYLDDSSTVAAIRPDLTPQHFISIGPEWARHWELTYFLLLIISSLAIKFAFRID